MSFWRQLRWRIIGSHLLIVVAGVIILLLATETVPILTSYENIQARVIGLVQTDNSELAEQAAGSLLQTFRNTLLISLGIAASGALIAGLFTSVLLTRLILQPLHEITASSQRIASGHYDERVAVPQSDELAMVATHFNQMAEALEQVEQQRVALIGNVSHELRTPLTGIEGYLEGMMDGLLPSNTETYAHMYQEVRRLRRLVDDLQALSRVEAGQVSLRLETIDLEAQCLVIAIKDTRDEAWVNADADRTAQILINLVGNAIRYTPDGGQITIRVRTKQQFAEVSIHDTGVGIPAESLAYIFERFYRVDSSRSRSSGGSGVGLTVSRHLAWAMGGDLIATSAGPDQGSTFLFTLPLPSTTL
jgi:histidine kinase